MSVVFTDIVGSTELAVAVGDREADHLRRVHFDLLTEAVAPTGGEVVKNLGDGLMIVYRGATDAVEGAIAIQRAVAAQAARPGSHALAVRVGLSAGDATNEDDDWFGTPVVEAARLCAAAASGQILATDLLRRMAGSRVVSRFSEVGDVRLKGFPEPVAAVEVLWDDVPAAAPRMPQTLTPPVRLVGRGAEVDRLNAVLDAAAAGRCAVALIEGEAGIGKSALAGTLIATATTRGFEVLAGRADDIERERPFRAVRELLPHGAATLDSRDMLQAVDAVVDTIERRALRGPVCVAIDDLQWADAATILALRALLRRLRDLPLALVATMRPLPRLPELTALLDDAAALDACHLAVAPLDDEALGELASGLVGAPPSRRFMTELRRAGGNPLFATELVHALQTEDAIDVGAEADVNGAALPTGLRHTILRRLAFLPTPTLEMLRVASVLGSTFSVSDLATVLGRSATSLLGDVHEAVTAGVVGEAGTDLAFRHDLIRDAVYEDIPAPLRTASHLEVGRILSESGAPIGRAVPHLVLGSTQDDPDAVARLYAASLRAGVDDFFAEGQLLDRALELVEPDSAEFDMLVAAAILGLVDRDPDRAAELGARALAHNLAPEPEVSVVNALAHLHTNRGRPDLGVAMWEEYVARPDAHRQASWMMLGFASNSRFLMGDVTGAREGAERVLAVTQGPHYTTTCMAHMTLTLVELCGGNVDQALLHGRAAVEIARANAAAWGGTPHSRLYLALVLAAVDDIDGAEALLRSTRRRDRAPEWRGRHRPLPLDARPARLPTRPLRRRGHRARSGRRGSRRRWHAARRARSSGRPGADRFPPRRCRRRGRVVAARREPRARIGPQLGIEVVYWAGVVSGDDPADLDATWQLLDVMRFIALPQSVGPDLVGRAAASWRARAGRGGGGRAARVGGRPRRGRVGKAAADRADALLAGDGDGMLAAAGASTRRADVSSTPPWPPLRRRAAGGGGSSRGRGRRRAPGARGVRGPRRRRRRGARHPALEQRGAKVRAKKRPARPVSGWDSLTPAELNVVHLVAAGKTNREVAEELFLSRHTVDSHVRHVFAKLGLSSRVDLAGPGERPIHVIPL